MTIGTYRPILLMKILMIDVTEILATDSSDLLRVQSTQVDTRSIKETRKTIRQEFFNE